MCSVDSHDFSLQLNLMHRVLSRVMLIAIWIHWWGWYVDLPSRTSQALMFHFRN